MARDRLAAMREQQRQQDGSYSSAPAPPRGAQTYGGSYGQQPQGSYPSRGESYAPPQPQRSQQPAYSQPSRNVGYPAPAQNSHPPPAGAYRPANGPVTSPPGGQDETSEFFSRIAEIQSATRDLNAQIDRIHDLHQRQLAAAVNEEEHARITADLTAEQDRTRQLSNSLKNEIKRLEAATAKRSPSDPDTNVRRTQVGAVKNRFMEAIQKYQQVEQDSRKRQQARMERQYKIVKPDATQDEIRAAVADSSGSGGQVFAQALRDSNRYGEARTAYREVSERHRDIQQIEKTLTELAQMFNDMALLVEEQDPMIQTIEAKANEAEVDTGHAETQLQKAVKSARAARRKRWICFIIFVIIAIIVAVVVAVEVTKNK